MRDRVNAPATDVSAPLFPVGLVLRGRKCLVVGGGEVAARKAAALAVCEATITVVAPEHCSQVLELARRVPLELQLRPYRRGEAARYRLVVAATGDAGVDQAVFDDAEAAGVWVNCADNPARCSVMLPAVRRDGPITVAVATGGASPAMSRWLRDKIAACVPRGAGQLASMLSDARAKLIEQGGSTETVDWRALLDGSLPDMVASGQIEEAHRTISEVLQAAQAAGLEVPPAAL